MRRLLALCAVLLAAGASLPSAAAGTLVQHAVVPSQIDSAVAQFDRASLAIYDKQKVKKNGGLLLFLPATLGWPTEAEELFGAAARDGYHVISLEYDNGRPVEKICRGMPSSCWADVRTKRVFGEDTTTLITDAPAESIIHRLTVLLQYLAKSYPSEGWGNYLDGSAPRWSAITISGHSQGSAMAAFIAKREALRRVALFSGPFDYGPDRQPAPWLSAPGATPPDRWYAMYHTKEAHADVLAAAYRALQIPASHIFAVSLPSRKITSGDYYHASVVTTGWTPIAANGQPAYLSDWLQMIGRP